MKNESFWNIKVKLTLITIAIVIGSIFVVFAGYILYSVFQNDEPIVVRIIGNETSYGDISLGLTQIRVGQQVLWTTDFIPDVNEAVDLGSTIKRIDNLYVKTGYFGVISSASGNISLWTNDAGYLSSLASESYWDEAYNQRGSVIAGTNLTWNGTQLDATDTTYSAGGVLLDLTGTVFSVNEGTLTNGNICKYNSTGTKIECNLVDNSANWNTAFGWGDHSGQGYLTTVAYGDLTGNPSDVITAGTGLGWATDTLNAEVQTSDLHAAVTITGQDYLTLSTQQITMGEIEPDDLAASDFGDFTCDGDDCTLDTNYLPLTGGTLTGGLFGTTASFSGNFEVDGGTFYVDAGADMVGIGTISPTVKFEVAGAASISGNFNLFGIFVANTVASHSFQGDLSIGDDLDVVGAFTFGSMAVDISDNTNLTIGATGIELSDDDIILSAGYEIPLTASTSHWETAYGWGDWSGEGFITATLTEEEVEDYVGGMLGGTETHIAVTYQDGTNDIDFVVADDWWDAVSDIGDGTITEVKLDITSAPTTNYLLGWDGSKLDYFATASWDTNTQLTEEQVEDFVGGMLGGTETLITITYEDASNDIDFVVNNDLHSYDWTNVVDGDITDALTITGYMQDGDINTFSELQSWVPDKTLVNEEDIFTIDANWVNTANPWDISTETNLTAGTNITLTDDELNIDDPFTIGHIIINTASVSVSFDVEGMASISGQLYVEDNRVVGWDEKCFTIASDTFDSYDNVMLWHPHANITVTDIYCKVTGGTSLPVTAGDGTNDMDTVTCDADGQADDGSIANNTFSANELMEVDFGTNTGACDWVNYCITFTID